MVKKWDTVIPTDLKAALHTVSFVQHGCFAGKCILTGSTEWIVQGRWQHGEKVGYCYPSGLEKTLCKWDTYVPLVTKGLKVHMTVFCPPISMYTVEHLYFLSYAQSVADKREKAGNILTSIFKNTKT
jgi:hypothetical protein